MQKKTSAKFRFGSAGKKKGISPGLMPNEHLLKRDTELLTKVTHSALDEVILL
jgi:hypothetical protein